MTKLTNIELHEIMKEFKIVTGETATSLEEVMWKIDDYQEEKEVQLIKMLDKSMVKFQNMVLDKIDNFEGNMYTSSMIPIVINIQRQFRKLKLTQRQNEVNDALNAGI